jgi:chromosome segregation ATPase
LFVPTRSTDPVDCTSPALQESLAALQTGQHDYEQFVVELLAEFEAAQEKLSQAEGQIDQQNRELAELRSRPAVDGQPAEQNGAGDAVLESKVAELESDRQALEEELENVRSRAVEMAQVIADQKRQMAEDQTQWMEEFRQLRRILDKQTKWITQQNEQNGSAASPPADATSSAAKSGTEKSSDERGEPSLELIRRAPAADSHKSAGKNSDPVLGSVLSQFEFLQKDVARHRKQGGSDRTAKKPSPPEKLNN